MGRERGLVFAVALMMIGVMLVPTIGTAGEQTDDQVFLAQTEISVGRVTFDVALGEPSLPSGWSITGYPAATQGLYLFQATQNFQPWMLEDLVSAGVQDYSYVNHNTYLIQIDSDTIDTIGDLPYAQWIGIHQPFYKLDPALDEAIGEVTVIVDMTDSADQSAIIGDLETLGGTIIKAQEFGFNQVHLTITASLLPEVAAEPLVVMVTAYHEPVAMMDNVRDSAYMGGDTVWNSGVGYTGANVFGGVTDNGFRTTHQDLGNVQFTQGGPGLDTTPPHGTSTAGIVFGSGDNGANSARARGHLPQANGVLTNWNFGRLNSATGIWGGFTSGMDGVFESNSWSQGSLDSQYRSYSRETDIVLNTYPYMMTMWAAGNSDDGTGWGQTTQDCVAKNNLCIGAIFHENSASMGDDDWRDSGAGGTPSRGFAKDTRLKPDLIGPFDWIYTTTSSSNSAYTSSFGGTSAATPIVAGQVGLVFEMYEDNYFGGNPLGDHPYGTTVKAMMIADAYQYPNFATQADRHEQGWGSADIENTYLLGAGGHGIFDGIDSVSAGDTVTYYVDTTGISAPLKISTVWSDPEASSFTGIAQALINNLDLKVIAPDATEYYGNNGLDDAAWSTNGFGANFWDDGAASNPGWLDDRNNVENVFIQTPMDGLWRIEVSGRSDEVPQGPQRFSVVASGAIIGNPNNPPSITMTIPNGGETFDAGTTTSIWWGATDLEDPASALSVDLHYSTTGSGGPWTSIDTIAGDAWPYSWTVPNAPSVNVYLRGTVTDTEPESTQDITDGPFTIQAVVDTTDPVADAGADQEGWVSYDATFDGSGSTDDQVIISLYQWNFNDPGPKTLFGVSPSYTFTNSGNFQVTLTVEDAAGNPDTDVMWVNLTPARYDVAVIAGWNLVSIPTDASGDPLSVFDDALGDGATTYSRLVAFDAATQTWMRYDAAQPAYMNGLTNVDGNLGMWMFVDNPGDAKLAIAGAAETSQTIPLVAGWNLVGYPSQTTGVSLVLGTLGVSVSAVISSHPTNDYKLQDLVMSTTDLEPGRAYWFFADAPGTWNVP